jgi:ribonucleoside-diphosphate reductase alpha chain
MNLLNFNNMFGEKQIEFLRKKKYLKNKETLEERFQGILSVIKKNEIKYKEPGLTSRIEHLIKNQILCLSTPQISNLGRYKENGSSPLNCSCNIIAVPNSIDGIYYSIGETAMLSKLGAGVGASFLNVCDKGTLLDEGFYSNSKLDWIEDLVRASQKVSQGSVRRGYAVPFISIDDPEMDVLLERTDKKNSDSKDPFVNNNVGIILPSGFRDRVKNGDKVAQKKLLKILKLREEKGKIYLLDIDNCNINTSPVYTKLGHIVNSTNICTEAITPSYDDMTFTCMLSSLNLKHWDIIAKDPQIIKDAIYFLDIMVEEYIELTENIPFLKKARKSAINKRDVGLGTMGFAEYLQMQNAAYGDIASRRINKSIYSTIKKYAEEASIEIALKLDSAPMCKEAGLTRRNVSLMMIAPNKSTSFIYNNTSLGIEPFLSNYFVKELAGIEITFKNPYLTELLIKKNKDTTEIWDSILSNLGSVQHLDFLSKEEKDVFLTANEISPKDIIDLASDRQVYIDMGQSLNLFNRPNYTLQDIYNIHMYAFDKGIKTLYYYYPQAHSSIEKVGESWDTCISCAD